MTNFDHHHWIFLTSVGAGGHTLPMTSFHATFSSLSIHFFRLLSLSQKLNMTFKTFTTYSLVVKSRQNFSNMVYFGNYQRISVSIETSAKCRLFTVMRLRAYTHFFKTKSFIHGVYSVLSLYADFGFQNYLLLCAETKGQTWISGKLRLYTCRISYPP